LIACLVDRLLSQRAKSLIAFDAVVPRLVNRTQSGIKHDSAAERRPFSNRAIRLQVEVVLSKTLLEPSLVSRGRVHLATRRELFAIQAPASSASANTDAAKSDPCPQGAFHLKLQLA